MKNSNIIVRIPEPCHEDWNNMEPDEKGKFCNSCSKSVFDFSNKTDSEIKDILIEYKDQKVCGHFKKSQINRPLNISVNLYDLPKNISTTKAFAIALFLVFGTFLFSCTNEHGQKIEKIEVTDTDSNKEHYTLGMTNFNLAPPLLLDSIITTSSTLTGDTVVMISEEHIDGGVGIEEIIPDEDTTLNAPVTAEPVPENFILGLMEVPYTYKDSSSVSSKDSTLDNSKLAINESIIRSKEFVIFPNPSNGDFTITYELKKKTNVRIDIIDMKGILLKTIVDISNQYDGKYQIPFNLKELPNGMYLINLIKNDEKYTERVVIER